MPQSILEKLTALPFNDLGQDEFVRKFRGTYLMVKTSPKATPQVAYFSDWSNPFMYFEDADGVQFRVDVNGDCEVYVEYPKSCVYSSNNSFHVCYRVPARQYSRGINKNNFRIDNPVMDLIAHPTNISISIGELERSFNPVYYDLDAACSILDEGKILGVGLNRKFGLSLSAESDDVNVLWYLTTPIALVDRKNKSISVKAESFTQEVTDYLRRENLAQWKVQ